jgi:hypothetical protein
MFRLTKNKFAGIAKNVSNGAVFPGLNAFIEVLKAPVQSPAKGASNATFA